MKPHAPHHSLPQGVAEAIQRRTFLTRSGIGLGSIALQALLGQQQASANAGRKPLGLPGMPNFAPRAKRVIFLCMAGGPSHLESFDYKPKLAALSGKPMPASFTEGQPIAQLQGQVLKAQGPMTRFGKYGQSGQEISDFFPWTQKLADEICIVRSLVSEQINHDPAHTFMNTGTAISGRPAMGSWVNYGLGSESDDLPGFVVLTSAGGRNPQPIASRQWSAGFLPSQFQGVPFQSTGVPVHYVDRPAGIDSKRQQELVQTIAQLDRHRNALVHNREINTRIAAYEMAYRMQTSVPELMDLSDESPQTLALYGANPGDGSYASNCLLARRLAERGVRFIHLYHRGWDHHDRLQKYMNVCCGLTDRATWALLTDLKQRGMLEDTLVIWGGEFGRTPMVQYKGGKDPGRDHHIKGFSMWLAGGGIQGGITYGATDELGYHSVENIVQMRDLHATMLYLLGIDPQRFSVKFQGLDMRLTGVEPSRVVRKILA